MDRKTIMSILKELKTTLDITDHIRLELRPMKTKAASISLKWKTIRINKFLTSNLDEEAMKYLILHELAHLKLNTTHHTNELYNLIYAIIDKNDVEKFETEILAKLIELSNKRNKRIINRITF